MRSGFSVFGGAMVNLLDLINKFVWGFPVLFLILAVGIGLSVGSRFAQIRLLPLAMRNFLQSFRIKEKSDGISGYRALCTALAATVGTGNIAGVAGAIAIGGPGVVFWMWVSAVLGMITKFAEVTLAVRFRRRNTAGDYIGGPMYMILSGLPRKYHILSYLYAFFGVVAAFGIGNATQVNAVMDGLKNIGKMMDVSFGVRESLAVGVIIALLIILIFSKGVEGIAGWAETLVPFAACMYIVFSLGILLRRADRLPYTLSCIIQGAFSPESATCGALTSIFLSLRVGISRGVFTNEAGMGTASIAHASANVSDPVQQGMMGIIEVFLDTIVICTLTAFVILCSDLRIPYGTDPGITLTLDAFASVYGDWIRIVLTGLVCIFAFATILGWSLYGARCAQFLFGDGIWKAFTYTQACGVVLGVVLNTGVVWVLAEILNGLMALPNLIALISLSPEFYRLVDRYQIKKNAHS